MKKDARSKHPKVRHEANVVRELRRSLTPCAEQSIPTPAISDLSQSPPSPALTAIACEQFRSDYSVHECLMLSC